MPELESLIEQKLIEQLIYGDSQWTYRSDLKTEADLWNNFKYILEQNNKDRLDGELLPDADRLTPFGNKLRHLSLDELPELWNILKGDMSIVGPRPLLVSYLPYYTERERLRHTVRPGLTGLAQVSGRNFLDWDKRLEKDAEYVEKLSFAEDVSIIGKTFGAVFGHKEQVAVDTNAVEGNLAQIRQDRINGREHPNTQRGNA